MNTKLPYDPAYDPLVEKTPGCGRWYAPTYWVDTAGEAPADDGVLKTDIEADVAIIGSGFTGLCTAIFLAQEHGIKAVVLEANQTSWGCSSRNGGQAQCASGRLSRSQWIQRYGLETAKALHQEMLDGMETFKELTRDINCDHQPGGHVYVAHRPEIMDKLARESELLRNVFSYDARLISNDELRAEYLDDSESFGAMHEPEGIGIHAAKLAFGYLQKARALGVRVYTSSPVIRWESNADEVLHTPHAQIRAKQVAICTGGYTSNALHAKIADRILPILSNSIVTRPLSDDEIEAVGWKTHQVITDTRVLRHYYRRLPDNRIQFGSRSAITGKDAPAAHHEKRLLNDLHRKFPLLKDVDIDYSWWGWVDVSHDMMPRIAAVEGSSRVYCALGYGGNGVMYSSQAGKRLAQLIAGKPVPALPIFQGSLRLPLAFNRIESRLFSPFRRIGQRFLYRWYAFKDERGLPIKR